MRAHTASGLFMLGLACGCLVLSPTMFEREMWGPPGAMSRANGVNNRAARPCRLGRQDRSASGSLGPRRPADSTPEVSYRGRTSQAAQRSASTTHHVQAPMSRKRVGHDVKKRPASGPRPGPAGKRLAGTTLAGTTPGLLPRDTGNQMDDEQSLSTTLGEMMGIPNVTLPTIPRRESANLPSMSAGVLAAIDANIGVHFPSLPRAPSKEFFSMIGDIVSEGNVTLADGLRMAENKRKSGR